VYDKIAGLYIQYSDEVYSNTTSDDLSFDKVLRLRATSHAIVRTIQKSHENCLLHVLFNSGADKTMMKRSALPLGVNPSLGKKRRVTGVMSSALLDKEVLIEDMILPEFSSNTRISGPIRAIIMDNKESSYDIIISMDLMQTLGTDIHNSSKTVLWGQLQVPFKPHDYFSSNLFQTALQDQMVSSFDEQDADDNLGYKSKTIKSLLYEQHDPHYVADQQIHLSTSQRQELAQLLMQFPKLFSSKLGCFPHKKVHLELQANAKPFCCCLYPVPKHHDQLFKDELQRLCDIGVLERCGPSEWLSPSFIIAKKDSRVRWIFDFRELNKFINRKVYNLPKIQDILLRRAGYTFLTKLDISMQYYMFELDDSSKELCTICTPFGNY
jgi:hypothetical protein